MAAQIAAKDLGKFGLLKNANKVHAQTALTVYTLDMRKDLPVEIINKKKNVVLMGGIPLGTKQTAVVPIGFELMNGETWSDADRESMVIGEGKGQIAPDCRVSWVGWAVWNYSFGAMGRNMWGTGWAALTLLFYNLRTQTSPHRNILRVFTNK
jgi:hypothetical protein